MCYYFNSKNQQRDRNSQNVKIWEANPPDIDITLLSNQIFCVPWYSIHEKKDTTPFPKNELKPAMYSRSFTGTYNTNLI